MPRRVLVLGLGNPTRSDDGIGLHVIERLRTRGVSAHVVLEEAGTAGLGILDLIAGFRRVVIIDAIDAGLEPGTVLELRGEDLEQRITLHAASSHEADLPTALALGRRLGLELPEVHVVAVQVEDVVTFSEQCTPQVNAAIDTACQLVLRRAGG